MFIQLSLSSFYFFNHHYQLPITNNEENPKNPNRSALNTLPTACHYLPTDPLQTQYLNETQNQLNQLCILCRVKDRKACQLQNLCDEFREKYECDTRVLRHKLELTESNMFFFQRKTFFCFVLVLRSEI
jgi:hypothetical protein